MAKQQSALPFKTGGGLTSKLVGLAVCGVAVALIIRDPAESAGWASDLVALFGHVVTGLADFLQDLA
jgi:hypothetical protein